MREYTSLNWLAAENAASRVFNGVHWRFDGTEGVRAGYGIADEIFDNLLRPLGGARCPALPPVTGCAIPDEDFETTIDDILTNTPTGT